MPYAECQQYRTGNANEKIECKGSVVEKRTRNANRHSAYTAIGLVF